MTLTEESQEFVTVSELVGRKVKIYPKEFDEIWGILHSITTYGVLIKVDKTGDYEFYPWHQVKLVLHESGKPVEKTTEIKEEEIEIVDSPKTTISETLPDDYEWDWDDTEETIALINDDEGEEVIKLDTESKEIEVYYDKDLNLSKELARKFDITKITRDYQE